MDINLRQRLTGQGILFTGVAAILLPPVLYNKGTPKKKRENKKGLKKSFFWVFAQADGYHFDSATHWTRGNFTELQCFCLLFLSLLFIKKAKGHKKMGNG
jgi:hypothetical protein